MKMFESIKDQIKEIKKIVFVTGAGISQESGIPTFRGNGGLWKNYDAMKLATIDAFYENPSWFGNGIMKEDVIYLQQVLIMVIRLLPNLKNT